MRVRSAAERLSLWHVHLHHASMKTHAAVLLLLLGPVLAACAGNAGVHTDRGPDAGDSVIAVPDTGDMLGDRLRRSLSQRGWSLLRYEPDALERNRDYARLAEKARYRLALTGRRIGNCGSDMPSYIYNTALIANENGHVALALTGADCLDNVAARFESELARRRITPPDAAAAE